MSKIAKSIKITAVLAGVSTVLFLQGCSYQEALRGKHEELLDSHQVTINKPCSLFTENMTRIEKLPEQTKYQYTCGKTDVRIVLKNEELTVNEKHYGRINNGDSIFFDQGKVLINSKEVHEVASK